MNQSFRGESSDKPFFDHVLQAIDSVHRVAGITQVPCDRMPLPKTWQGQFDPYTRTVTVSPDALLPLTTGVHEIGHAIDALFLVTASQLGRLDGPITLYASEYAVQGKGLLVDWFVKAKQSRPIQEISQMALGAPLMSVDWYEATYWLDPKEVWARAYEQFIAELTNDSELKAQFQQKRRDELEIGTRKTRVYWSEGEFEPIAQEIKRLLQMLRWM